MTAKCLELRQQGGGHAPKLRLYGAGGLTEADSSVIVAEVTYGFTPLLDLRKMFSPGAFEMKRTFYARPRRSLTVTKTTRRLRRTLSQPPVPAERSARRGAPRDRIRRRPRS